MYNMKTFDQSEGLSDAADTTNEKHSYPNITMKNNTVNLLVKQNTICTHKDILQTSFREKVKVLPWNSQ